MLGVTGLRTGDPCRPTFETTFTGLLGSLILPCIRSISASVGSDRLCIRSGGFHVTNGFPFGSDGLRFFIRLSSGDFGFLNRGQTSGVTDLVACATQSTSHIGDEVQRVGQKLWK